MISAYLTISIFTVILLSETYQYEIMLITSERDNPAALPSPTEYAPRYLLYVLSRLLGHGSERLGRCFKAQVLEVRGLSLIPWWHSDDWLVRHKHGVDSMGMGVSGD